MSMTAPGTAYVNGQRIGQRGKVGASRKKKAQRKRERQARRKAR